jgi:hypothetical protein
MSCFSCINPHRKDIKIDIEHAPRSSSRYSSGYTGFSLISHLFLGSFTFSFVFFVVVDEDNV